MSKIIASPIEWSYLAGRFDGEGCVRATENKPLGTAKSPRFRIVVGITNTSERLINWIHNSFGGSVQVKHLPGRDKATKICYLVAFNPKAGEALLNGMMPYLIVKRDQAIMALKLRAMVKSFSPSITKQGRGIVLPLEEIVKRRGVLQSLSDLKKVQ